MQYKEWSINSHSTEGDGSSEDKPEPEAVPAEDEAQARFPLCLFPIPSFMWLDYKEKAAPTWQKA